MDNTRIEIIVRRQRSIFLSNLVAPFIGLAIVALSIAAL
jgi:hypothetical protein